MDSLALERVEVAGKLRHQRLALARRHFGDLAAVEHDAADHLHVEMAHAERADRRLAHRRKGFGQDRSEEHTSELQSLMRISYAVFCLKKKKKKTTPRSI